MREEVALCTWIGSMCKLQQKLIALPVGNSAKLDLSADGYPTQGCMVQEWKTVK